MKPTPQVSGHRLKCRVMESIKTSLSNIECDIFYPRLKHLSPQFSSFVGLTTSHLPHVR